MYLFNMGRSVLLTLVVTSMFLCQVSFSIFISANTCALGPHSPLRSHHNTHAC